MITGKTQSGFEFSIDENALNDMELFDDLVEIDNGNTLAISSVCNRILGKQKMALYDHLRGEDGRVPMDKVVSAVGEILKASSSGKKS